MGLLVPTQAPTGASPASSNANTPRAVQGWGDLNDAYNGSWYGSSTGGLVNDPRIGNGGLPPGFQGTANTAYTRQAQPNELTSWNLQGLLDGNSPYIQSARNHATAQANSRGLLNSSIAAGNAQRAAIDAGAPIAAQDAAAYGKAASQNQDYLNQIQMSQIGAGATMGAASSAAAASKYAADIGLQRQREQLGYSGEQAGLDRSFTDYMAERNYGFNLGSQNNNYMNSLGIQDNQAGHNLDYGMRMGAFNAAVNQGNMAQQFRYNFGLSAMNNPFVMQDPEAMGSFMNHITGDYGNTMGNYLDFALQGDY